MNQLISYRTIGSSPALVAAAGDRARERFIEFFTAKIRNRNTRRAYAQAVSEFLARCEDHRVPSITAVQPVHVAGYIEELTRARSAPTAKHAAGVDANQTVGVHNTASVAHQSAGRCEVAKAGDRGHGVAKCQCSEPFALGVQKCIVADHERARPHRASFQPGCIPTATFILTGIPTAGGCGRSNSLRRRICLPSCLEWR